MKTFLISSDPDIDDELLYRMMKSEFIKHGWKQITAEQALATPPPYDKFIDVAIVFRLQSLNMKYDERLYNIPVGVKNQIVGDLKLLGDKHTLHNIVSRKFPSYGKYFCHTYTKNFPTTPIIIKPSSKLAYSGKDIYIIEKPNHVNVSSVLSTLSAKYPRILITDYITRPLLYNYNDNDNDSPVYKKFHIRLYYIVAIHSNNTHNTASAYTYDMCPEGMIYTAKSEYATGDYHSKEIHDTHYSSTRKNLYYPADLISGTKLSTDEFARIQKSISDIGDLTRQLLILANVKRLPDSASCYKILGIDVMITDRPNLDVKVLEINTGPGIGPTNKYPADQQTHEHVAELHRWILKHARIQL